MQFNLNVLIVENDRGILRLLMQLAESQGHRVVAAVGAHSIDQERGIVATNPRAQPFEMNPRQFDVSLCDGILDQAPACFKYGGIHFVDVLAGAGVVCHGISSSPKDNADMVAKGAASGFVKPLMIFALQDGVVSFADLYFDPAGARACIDEFAAVLFTDTDSLNKRVMSLCEQTQPQAA